MSEKLRRAISEQFARDMSQRMDEMIAGSLFTSTTAEPPPPLDVGKMLEDCRKMMLNARRLDVTFVVDKGHEGGILSHDTPCDGKVVEMSWQDANRLHQQWPLKISKVVSEDRAEFVPVSGVFPEYVGKNLPAFPFDVPPSEQSDA